MASTKDKAEVKQDGGDAARPTPSKKPDDGASTGPQWLGALPSPGMKAALPVFVREGTNRRLVGFAAVSHPGALAPGGYLDQELRKTGISGATLELPSNQPRAEIELLAQALEEARREDGLDAVACLRAIGLAAPRP